MSKAQFTFLLIDDEKSAMGAFIDAGKQRRILIRAVDNVEEGLDRLKADPEGYQAVILDAKCKLKKTDQAESYNEAALHTALRQLDEMARRSGNKLPRCIYTGHSEAAANNEVQERVFMKGGRGTESAVFDYLVGAVRDHPRNVVLERYKDVFSMFDSGHLPAAGKEVFILLLMEQDEVALSEVRTNIGRIRKGLEMLLKQYSALIPRELPPSVLRAQGWVSDAIHRLAARGSYENDVPQILPEHLFSILYTTQKASSATGSHYHEGFVSHYAMRSLTYGLLEALLWFKEHVNNNHPDRLP
ncbi:MAG: hypothetical protein KDC03_16190 [Flavobacteriales bacterium]|nr:hypothetical protein [Flavobacteriales bacterium]